MLWADQTNWTNTSLNILSITGENKNLSSYFNLYAVFPIRNDIHKIYFCTIEFCCEDSHELFLWYFGSNFVVNQTSSWIEAYLKMLGKLKELFLQNGWWSKSDSELEQLFFSYNKLIRNQFPYILFLNTHFITVIWSLIFIIVHNLFLFFLIILSYILLLFLYYFFNKVSSHILIFFITFFIKNSKNFLNLSN